jgi:hypothetical protein
LSASSWFMGNFPGNKGPTSPGARSDLNYQ